MHIKSKRIEYFLFIIIFNTIFFGLLLVNTNNSQISSADAIKITQTPLQSTDNDWYVTWGDISQDDVLCGMDVYKNTGDVYLIGYIQEPDYNLTLVKYNSSGNMKWSIELDSGYNSYDNGKDIVVDQSNGDLYIVGSMVYDIFVAKYNSDGIQQWNTTWGYSSSDYGNGIDLDSTNSFLYVVGNNLTGPVGNTAIFLIKFDKVTGNQVWNVTWDDSFQDLGSDVSCGPYGDIYVTGSSGQSTDNKDMVLIKYDENKIEKWNITWDDFLNNETGNAVTVDSQDNVYVTGKSDGGFSNSSMFIRKYSNLSTFYWGKFWNNEFNSGDGKDIYLDSNENVFIAVSGAGTQTSSTLMWKEYNPIGIKISECSWKDTDTYYSTMCVSGFDPNNIYLAGIMQTGVSTESDFILVKGTQICPSKGKDDDGDNGNKELSIPLNNYFLFISSITIFALIINESKKRYKNLN